MQVVLLADLSEPVGPDAWGAQAVFAFEMADALRESAADVGEFSVDLVARRGSWRGLPLISIEPDELHVHDDPVARFARQEAAYLQLVLTGMLSGYDLIHCLAPIVTPLQVLAHLRLPILHSATDPDRDVTVLLRQLLGQDQLVQLRVTSGATSTDRGEHAVTAPIDVSRFDIVDPPTASYAVSLGSSPGAEQMAQEVSAQLQLPLKRAGHDEPAALLQHAAVLLQLDRAPACGSVWTLRALACGTPFATWHDCGLDELLAEPALGAAAPLGDAGLLAERIRTLPMTTEARLARRQAVVSRHTRRSIIGRYRTVYREIADKGARARTRG